MDTSGLKLSISIQVDRFGASFEQIFVLKICQAGEGDVAVPPKEGHHALTDQQVPHFAKVKEAHHAGLLLDPRVLFAHQNGEYCKEGSKLTKTTKLDEMLVVA